MKIKIIIILFSFNIISCSSNYKTVDYYTEKGHFSLNYPEDIEFTTEDNNIIDYNKYLKQKAKRDSSFYNKKNNEHNTEKHLNRIGTVTQNKEDELSKIIKSKIK